MQITRVGYQAMLEAAEQEPAIRKWLDTKGHKVIVIIEAEDVDEERLAKATEKLLEDLTQ